MDLREALLDLLYKAPMISSSRRVVSEALHALPDDVELTLWPAEQAEYITHETQKQQTKDAQEIVARLVVVEQDMGIPEGVLVKPGLWVQIQKLRDEVADRDNGLASRLDDLATLEAANANRIHSLADDVMANNELLVGSADSVLSRLDAIEKDLVMPDRALLANLSSQAGGNLDVRTRVGKLEQDVGLADRALEDHPSTAEKLANLATAESGEITGLRERVAMMERELKAQRRTSSSAVEDVNKQVARLDHRWTLRPERLAKLEKRVAEQHEVDGLHFSRIETLEQQQKDMLQADLETREGLGERVQALEESRGRAWNRMETLEVGMQGWELLCTRIEALETNLPSMGLDEQVTKLERHRQEVDRRVRDLRLTANLQDARCAELAAKLKELGQHPALT